MSTVLNVSGHAVDLSDGRPLAPGETADDVDVTTENPHNQSLVRDGLVAVTKSSKEGKAL